MRFFCLFNVSLCHYSQRNERPSEGRQNDAALWGGGEEESGAASRIFLKCSKESPQLRERKAGGQQLLY